MRIQLWSYNYDPEPTGIAPLSTVWAREMAARGHEISVVAAHPHYPEPRWGSRLTPYREVREGIAILRLPLWSGRATTAARLRQEVSFTLALGGALAFLGTPDVVVAVSPCFPALAPAMLNARLRRIPWVLWLQDILPDGAAVTGILDEGMVVGSARHLERAAYDSAARIVVISDSFAQNLCSKGVPKTKVTRIYNPASRPILTEPRTESDTDGRTVLTMGNIGRTQNLVAVTEAFQASDALSRMGARFVMAGDGVAGDAVRAAIRSDRIRVTGVLDSDPLEAQLRKATVALVSQDYDGVDFNVPSKLMNFMGYGIATVACVRPESEVAHILDISGGGWVVALDRLGELSAQVLNDEPGRSERGRRALSFAQEHFAPSRTVEQFEQVLEEVVGLPSTAGSWSRSSVGACEGSPT